MQITWAAASKTWIHLCSKRKEFDIFIVFSSPHQTVVNVNHRTFTFFGSKARSPISKVIVVHFPWGKVAGKQEIMLFISVLARALHAGHFTWTPTEPWVFISVYLASGEKIYTCAYCWEAVGLSRWSFNLHFVTSWAIKEVRWTYLLSSFFPFSLAVFIANKANTLSDEIRRGSVLVLNAWVDVSLLYDVLFPLYYNSTDDAETDTWDVNWMFFNAVNGIECSINFFVIICVFSLNLQRVAILTIFG